MLKTMKVNNNFTSSDFIIVTDKPTDVVGFLNDNNFKKTATWRLPETTELVLIYEELYASNPFFKHLWCIDHYSKTLSVFDTSNGTHEKCNGRGVHTGEKLPLFAVSAKLHAPLIEKEMAIQLNNSNQLGVSIAHGSFGEFLYSDEMVNMFNQTQLFQISNWRLPTIEELERIHNTKEALGISIQEPIWTSTIERKFFVQVIDFKTGEISQIKK